MNHIQFAVAARTTGSRLPAPGAVDGPLLVVRA